MDLFHVIDDAQAIVRSRGVYRQVKVYHRGGKVYAGHGNGFIRLHAHNGTSAPNISWVGLDLPSGLATEEKFDGVTLQGAKVAAIAAE